MCIYVREITNEEGNRLKYILRRSSDKVKVKRAQIILASAQSMKVPEICKTLGFHRNYVCRIIHAFNEKGFEALESGYKNCGRKPTFNEEIKRKIIDVVLSNPKDLGLPFTEWSLEKIRMYLIKKGIVKTISINTIRRILNEKGITYKRTKTWKESNDPEFEFKKRK